MSSGIFPSELIELAKQYGPLAAVLLAFIWWQARWINRLLDRHERAYTGEISRMHEREKLLLERLLGHQPSSLSSPSLQDQQLLPNPNSNSDV